MILSLLGTVLGLAMLIYGANLLVDGIEFVRKIESWTSVPVAA